MPVEWNIFKKSWPILIVNSEVLNFKEILSEIKVLTNFSDQFLSVEISWRS